MDLNELIESTLRSQHLEEMQNRPREEYSPIKGMSSEQIERYACFLYKELQVRTQELERMNVRLDEIMDELKKSGKKIDNLTGLLEKANDRADKALLESKMHQKENIELKKMNATLQQRLNLMNSMAFGPSKSQKGIEKKKPVRGRHDDKDDFDGTSQSLAPAEEPAEQPREEKAPKESRERPGRKGMVYNKSVVGTPIIHKSDYSRLPPGAVVISSKFKVVRDVISRIEEHHFEVLKVKYADGHIRSVYLPIPGEAGAELYDEVVPGTHITASLLSYLLFNRFQMATPANREARNRLADMDWLTSPQNLLNWADKGAIQLNRLIPALKKVALCEGANVNVDETWLRYRTVDVKRKTYMWCLVNRKARIVIFFYEDTEDGNGNPKHGGRNRNVLVVAVTNSPKHDFNRCKSATCRFLFRDTKSARDKNGTKPRKNKVKDTSPEISLVEYLCFVCKGTNLSLEKRGEIPISLIHNSFSYHCTPNVVIANGFDLKQHDLRKSGVKFCFAL